MSILTPFFNLIKPAKNDPAAIAQLNANMDKIDAEMHKPPLTFNGIEPDPTTRNLQVTTVPLADNLTSDEAQINTGTYIIRTSGGEASVSNGAASLSNIQGNMVKNGYVAQSVSMAVTGEDIQDTTIDNDAFIAEVTSASGTMTFTFTTAWDVNPANYGITVVGTPASGNTIVVTYTKENRGTITTASPTSFVSTGWNLYNNVTGYARVLKYSDEYGFMISGTYTSIAFARTLNGTQTAISPVNGAFDLPAGETSGYIIVTGGNATDTAIWITWSDWTEQANGGTFEPYTQTLIDLSEVMLLFPYGMMKVGNVADEINLNTQRAYNRIEKMEYTDANLEDVIASGMPYETDSGYIYAVMEFPTEHVISIDGNYTVSDHGTEMFYGTNVPLTASSLYGNDLKGKLRRDVVTISQQDLTASQKAQVLQNIGAVSTGDVANNLTTTASGKVLDARQGKALNEKIEKRKITSYSISAGATKDIPFESGARYFIIVNSAVSTVKDLLIGSCSSSGVVQIVRAINASNLAINTGTANVLKLTNNATNSCVAYVEELQ